MRDGVGLSTELYFPKADAHRFPVVLIRTPYNKAFHQHYGSYFSERGFVVAIQDVRGRFASTGEWIPFVHEGRDGYDTVEWLAARDWCNGKVGMLGGSYSGSAQYLAARERPPHLACIIPSITPAMPFDGIPYENGVLLLGWAIRWTDVVENARSGKEFQDRLRAGIRDDWTDRLSHLPVVDIDNRVIGKRVTYWRDWIAHSTLDSYWEGTDGLEAPSNLEIPVLIQSGWYDPGTRGARLAVDRLRAEGNPNVRMIVGPWSHSDRGGRMLDGRDMGSAADVDLYALYARWFDRWLRDDANGVTAGPAIELYVMGANRWLEDNVYPPREGSPVSFFLSADGDHGEAGPGLLTRSPVPDVHASGTFTYDPGQPTPSFSAYLRRGEIGRYFQEMSGRKDVLAYETVPLDAELTIAGPVSVDLYAASSARDTDWFATLYALDQRGVPYPIGLTFGAMRARFRASRLSPTLLEPGRIYPFHLDLAHTAVTIPKGHRLRLEIASASFPEYSRNLNTGEHSETESDFVVAHQRVFHTLDHPSRLTLHVIRW